MCEALGRAVVSGEHYQCALCRDAMQVSATPKRGFAHICGWDAHVAHADRQHCWLRPAQRQLVPLEAMLLQPLPAFIWLDLDEDASADEAKAAFRKLSRKHHPDRGGSEAAWQLSGECMRLLRDDERIATYLSLIHISEPTRPY